MLPKGKNFKAMNRNTNPKDVNTPREDFPGSVPIARKIRKLCRGGGRI